jgi:hypothetical protein
LYNFKLLAIAKTVFTKSLSRSTNFDRSIFPKRPKYTFPVKAQKDLTKSSEMRIAFSKRQGCDIGAHERENIDFLQ